MASMEVRRRPGVEDMEDNDWGEESITTLEGGREGRWLALDKPKLVELVSARERLGVWPGVSAMLPSGLGFDSSGRAISTASEPNVKLSIRRRGEGEFETLARDGVGLPRSPRLTLRIDRLSAAALVYEGGLRDPLGVRIRADTGCEEDDDDGEEDGGEEKKEEDMSAPVAPISEPLLVTLSSPKASAVRAFSKPCS